MTKVLLVSLYALFLAAFGETCRAEVSFPKHFSVIHQNNTYTLSKTGETLREFFFIDIYRIAHYAETSVLPIENAKDVITKSFPKQLNIVYQRDIAAKRVRKVLRQGFENNASSDELLAINSELESFLGQLKSDIQQEDELVVQWFPGGQLLFSLNGSRVLEVENPIFARILWSIWLGDKAVVDRDELLFGR